MKNWKKLCRATIELALFDLKDPKYTKECIEYFEGETFGLMLTASGFHDFPYHLLDQYKEKKMDQVKVSYGVDGRKYYTEVTVNGSIVQRDLYDTLKEAQNAADALQRDYDKEEKDTKKGKKKTVDKA